MFPCTLYFSIKPRDRKTLLEVEYKSTAPNIKHFHNCLLHTKKRWGWFGGAKVLGKLSVPGRPTGLGDSRARAYCACSRCGWGVVWTFFSHLSFLISFSLSLGDGLI